VKDMYLSRVLLDISKRKTQMALASPGKFHGAVETAFAEKQERNLWRIDTLQGKTYLLLLSAVKPDLAVIEKQFGYENIHGESKEYEKLLNRIQKGSVWHFRLTANPIHSVKNGEGRGKVTAHISEKHQLEWLNRQAAKKGFYVLPETARVQGVNWRRFYKQNRGRKVCILEVTYEGMLRVENADLLKQALVDGVGRGKAYGMGLLTVAGMEG